MLKGMQEHILPNKSGNQLQISDNRTAVDTKTRWHEEIEIKYVLSGKLNMMIETEIVTASAGDVIFINPYEVHSNVMVEQAGTYCLIMLGLDYFPGGSSAALDLRQLMLDKHIKNHIQNPRVSGILQQIREEFQNENPYKELALSGLFQQLFAVLLQKEQSDTQRYASDLRAKFYKTVEPAVIKMRDEYASNHTGEELAQLCGLDRYYFCRAFKKAMGTTPVEYRNQCRIRVAELLLQDGQYSIAEVAAQTGFEDASYFSRIYKKYKGVSPVEKKTKSSK